MTCRPLLMHAFPTREIPRYTPKPTFKGMPRNNRLGYSSGFHGGVQLMSITFRQRASSALRRVHWQWWLYLQTIKVKHDVTAPYVRSELDNRQARLDQQNC